MSLPFIIDGHTDILLRIDVEKQTNLQSHPDDSIKGGVGMQITAIFTPDEYLENAYDFAIDILDNLFLMIKTNHPKYWIYQGNNDIKKIEQEYKQRFKVNYKKKIGFLVSLEGAEPLGDDPFKIEEFHKLGIRLVTIAWSRPNAFACGVGPANNHKGLTSKGKQLIKLMNKLGIIIDVSHLNREGILDTLEISDKPVIASHSNVYSICDNVRNLTDDLIRLIAEKGGFLGMCFNQPFLVKTKPARIEDLEKHIRYMLDNFSSDSIAWGSDFDGITDWLLEIENSSEWRIITDYLSDNMRLPSDIIDKINYKNWLRILSRCT